MADGVHKELTRREFLNLGVLTGGVLLLGACAPRPKEDLSLPEDYFSDIKKGTDLWLTVKGEKKLVTIRYNDEVSPLFTRGEVETGEGKEVNPQIAEFVSGQSSRRKTGEILEASLTELTIRPDAQDVGVWMSPWVGQSEAERLHTLKEGARVFGLAVVTGFLENVGIDGQEFETNARGNQPPKFAKGWAVGELVNELDNTKEVFRIKGYVWANELMVPTETP